MCKLSQVWRQCCSSYGCSVVLLCVLFSSTRPSPALAQASIFSARSLPRPWSNIRVEPTCNTCACHLQTNMKCMRDIIDRCRGKLLEVAKAAVAQPTVVSLIPTRRLILDIQDPVGRSWVVCLSALRPRGQAWHAPNSSMGILPGQVCDTTPP